MFAQSKTDATNRLRRGRPVASGSRSLWSSILAGFGAFALIGECPPMGRRYPGKGVADDWRAIGDDLRVSMKRHEQRQPAP